jgi:hypothetical protein
LPVDLNPTNRPVRTRMPGGVAGDVETKLHAPMPIPETSVVNGEVAAYWIPAQAGATAAPENPLLVPGVPRPAPARRYREYDETESNHHHSHEFESKGVHGNSLPDKPIELWGAR